MSPDTNRKAEQKAGAGSSAKKTPAEESKKKEAKTGSIFAGMDDGFFTDHA